MEAILISVAAAAAGKASEAVVKSGAAAVRNAAELVRRRFAGTPELKRAERGDIAVEDLAEAIQDACARDEGFRRSLSEAVDQTIQVAKFRNAFHGSVKNVAQIDPMQSLRVN